MYRTIKQPLFAIVLCALCNSAASNNKHGQWSLVPNIGVSILQDQSTAITGSDDIDGNLDVRTDAGFTAGLGLRYRYGPRWESEIAWEYRRNEGTFENSGSGVEFDGDYASNIFFLNVRRYLGQGDAWTPYLGVGTLWVEEIDLDANTDSGENSFSDGGALGVQAMAGIEIPLSNSVAISTELRYGSISGLTLDSEEAPGEVGKLNYNPLTAQVALAWKF